MKFGVSTFYFQLPESCFGAKVDYRKLDSKMVAVAY